MTDDHADKALADAFDIQNLQAGFADDPFPTYRALLAHAPVKHFPDGSIMISRWAEMDRVYLPDEHLERFRLTRDDLLGGPAMDDRFRELMQFEWERAQKYYLDSAPLLELTDKASRPALWAMMTIYHGVLLRIRDIGYDVYHTRARLSTGEKAMVVARAGWSRLTGNSAPFPP